jgi:serine/threonine-protein kinase RsbW
MTYQEPTTTEREVIEISFPGSVDFVVLARFTAATIAARAGFDLDEIDDLRLAVDELTVSFGPLDGETCLRFEFFRDGDTVSVRCTREPMKGVRGETPPVSDVVNWQQARALSAQLLEELVTAHGREITNGHSVAWLTKQRGAGTGR